MILFKCFLEMSEFHWISGTEHRMQSSILNKKSDIVIGLPLIRILKCHTTYFQLNWEGFIK